jgi:hypothetical protein
MAGEDTILIQLIGIAGDVRYEALRYNVLEAISYLPYAFCLEEVNDVSSIIKHNLNAIPALLIRGEHYIEAHLHIPTVGEIIQYLDFFFQKYYSSKNLPDT